MKTLLITLLTVCVINACSRGSGRGRSSSSRYSHDMNKNQLTDLYNSPVTKVESYSRPLSKLGVFKHTGVVATTRDSGRYLIHKGPGYGHKSSTVVVDAKHMSNRWRKTGGHYTSGKTISDLMKHGYVDRNYGPFPGQSLCWGASSNTMDKTGRKRRRRGC